MKLAVRTIMAWSIKEEINLRNLAFKNSHIISWIIYYHVETCDGIVFSETNIIIFNNNPMHLLDLDCLFQYSWFLYL